MITEMLASPLMQRALIAAVLVGLAAPVVGTYLVQRGLGRRLSHRRFYL